MDKLEKVLSQVEFSVVYGEDMPKMSQKVKEGVKKLLQEKKAQNENAILHRMCDERVKEKMIEYREILNKMELRLWAA